MNPRVGVRGDGYSMSNFTRLFVCACEEGLCVWGANTLALQQGRRMRIDMPRSLHHKLCELVH